MVVVARTLVTDARSNRVSRDRLQRRGIVGETAEGTQGNEFVSLCYSERCRRECTAGNGVFEDFKGGGEARILPVVGGGRESGGLGLGASQNHALVGVMGLVIAKSAGSVKQRDGGGDGTSGCRVSLRRLGGVVYSRDIPKVAGLREGGAGERVRAKGQGGVP